MPDRPGALGQVASRIGAVRGDVLAIEILEQGAGRVIDELTVALPDEGLVPLLTAEIDAVDGVSVENIRTVDIDRADANLAALAVGAAMAECAKEDRLEVLCYRFDRALSKPTGSQRWAPTARCGNSARRPTLRGSQHFWQAASTSTRSTTLPRVTLFGHTCYGAGLNVVAGRDGRPIHERERIRVNLLGRLAGALL